MSRDASSSSPEAGFPVFDWLRLVLASVVVVGHAGLPMWSMAANFAVTVFFALSGWLIGGILLRITPAGLPRFYFNRSLRIWTPYFAAVLLLYGVAGLFGRLGGIWYQFLFYDLTFTHYWFIPKIGEVTSLMPLQGTGAHFWSISVEEQFYVLAPLILLLPSFGKSVFLWILLSIGLTAVDYHYGSISCGVLASVLRWRYGAWYSGRLARIAIAVLAAVAVWIVYEVDTLYRWLVPLASIGTVLATSVEGGRTALGKFFGGVSYPLYLNHWLGIFIANSVARLVKMPEPMHIFLAYILAILVASIAYLAIDIRVLNLRKTHYTLRTGTVLMTCAYSLLAIGIIGGLFFFKRLGAGLP